jgi:arginine utilization protein RocB
MQSAQHYLEQQDEIKKLKEDVYQRDMLILTLRKIIKQLKDAMDIMREESREVNRDRGSNGGNGDIQLDLNQSIIEIGKSHNNLMVFKNKHPLCPQHFLTEQEKGGKGTQGICKSPKDPRRIQNLLNSMDEKPLCPSCQDRFLCEQYEQHIEEEGGRKEPSLFRTQHPIYKEILKNVRAAYEI